MRDNSKVKIISMRRFRNVNSRLDVLVPAIVIVSLLLFSTISAETLSLDLSQAIDMAMENNHDLAISKYKVAEATAGVRSARTNFLPKLKAQAIYTRLDEVPYINGSAFGNMFEPLQAPFEDLVDKGYLDPSTLAGLSGAGGGGKIYVGDDDNYDINLSLQQPIFTGFTLINNLKISNYQKSSAELLGQRTKETVRQQAADKGNSPATGYAGVLGPSEYTGIGKRNTGSHQAVRVPCH